MICFRQKLSPGWNQWNFEFGCDLPFAILDTGFCGRSEVSSTQQFLGLESGV